jgi:hypothetical protein
MLDRTSILGDKRKGNTRIALEIDGKSAEDDMIYISISSKKDMAYKNDRSFTVVLFLSFFFFKSIYINRICKMKKKKKC